MRGKQLMDGYWERVAERGKDESPYRAAFAQIICVGETDEEAERLYAEHVAYFYNRCLHVYPGFADAPGYRTIKTLKADVLDAAHARSMQTASPTLTWKDLVDDGYVIAGSPETVRERMEDMIKGLRVGHVFCLLHIGNMPDEKTRHSTQAVRRAGHAAAARHVAGVEGRRPLVVQADGGPAAPEDVAAARRRRAR